MQAAPSLVTRRAIQRRWHLGSAPMLAALLALTACGGGGGGGGSAGTGGATGTEAPASNLVTSGPLAVGSAMCPSGGIQVETGFDTNRNGQLDASEVVKTQPVCNGADGSSVTATIEPAGSNCPAGGVRLDQSSGGVTYVCNGSSTGGSIAVVNEPAGANCSAGGLRITQTSGTVSYVCNGSNVSTATEPAGSNCPSGGVRITPAAGSSTYVCNGTAGTNGTSVIATVEPSGVNCAAGGTKLTASSGAVSYVCSGISVTTTTELAGSNCPSGGLKLTNSTGSIAYVCNGNSISAVIEPAGSNCANGGVRLNQTIGSATFVCNGTAGSSGTTISTTVEPRGANCTAGGVRLTLSTGSVSYICNGIDGVSSSGGGTTDQNYISKSWRAGEVSSFTCDSASSYSNFKNITYYYSLASNGTGTPYRVCVNEYCGLSPREGESSRTISKLSGDSTCGLSYYESISCKPGYVLGTQGTCVSPDTLCPVGQIATSRGCEVPVNSCDTKISKLTDNQCIAVNFTPITGNICGTYTTPVRILAGSHLVTCNTAFKDRVLIEPGTDLRIDNAWGLRFEGLIYAIGNSLAPITFSKSAGNPAGTWGPLVVDPGYNPVSPLVYDVLDGYTSGNHLAFVNVSDATYADASINQSYLERSTFASSNVSIDRSFVDSTTITAVALIEDSDVIRSTIGSSGTSSLRNWSNSSDNGLSMNLLWSTVNGPLNIYGWSSDGIAALFNNFATSIYCSTSGSNRPADYIQGNRISTAAPANCTSTMVLSDNSTSAVSTKSAVHIRNGDVSIPVGTSLEFNALALDKTGWIQNANIVWKLKYDVDGVVYDSGQTWTGYSPSITFNTKESYTLYIDTVNGLPASQFLGKHAITVSVY